MHCLLGLGSGASSADCRQGRQLGRLQACRVLLAGVSCCLRPAQLFGIAILIGAYKRHAVLVASMGLQQ